MLTKRELLRSAALAAIAASTATIPSRRKRRRSAECPGFFKAKDIAEEGFIYGLPIVMNYAVMYEYAVDREFGAVQGPVQSDQERAQRLHLQRHRHSHAEQRHALFVRMAGSARRADRPFGPGGGPEALLLGACFATAIPTTMAISAAVPPEASQATTWWSGRIGRARPRPGSRRCSGRRTQFSVAGYRTQLFNPDDMPTTSRRSRPATRCSRFPPI